MKKTNIFEGACFGFYEKELEACENCCLKNSCSNATNSTQVKEVRKIKKNTKSIIDKLGKEWKNVDN